MNFIKKVFIVLSLAVFIGCSQSAPVEPKEEVKQEEVKKEEVKQEEVKPEAATETPKPEEKTSNETEKAINIVALKGPTAIGMVGLMDENEKKSSTNKYNFEIVGTADEVTAKIIKGEADIAAIPANMASVLYNKTEGSIKAAAINTLGVLYVIDTTDSIQSIEDLKGKKVFSVGKGTTPEFVFNYILAKNGLTLDADVTVEYKSEATELATLLASGEAEIAILPEPYVTTVLAKNEKAKVALSLEDEWNKVEQNASLVTGTVIVNKKFAENNKGQLDSFLTEYKKSVDFVNTNLDDSSKLVAKYGIIPSDAVAKKAIPACNIVFINNDEMEKALSGYLDILFSSKPESVGGKLPDEQFYYKN